MLKYFLVSSFFLCIVNFLTEIFSDEKKEKKFLISFIFLFLSIFLFQGFLWSSELILEYPNLAFTHVIGILLIGPLFERFIFIILEIELESKKKFFLKLVFISLLFLLITPYYFLPYEKKVELILKNYLGENSIQSRIILSFYAMFLFFYFVKIFLKFKNHFNLYSIRKNETLKLLSSIILLGLISSILAGIFILKISIYGLYTNSCLIGFFLVIYQILIKKYPFILNNLKTILEEEKKYKISQIKNLNLNEVKSKINNLMEIEKVFLDEEFSLSDLGVRLGLSTHQISEFLNQELKISFFQLLNRYRIEEAKKLILQKKEQTVLSIAYEVGFNSKSSFNDAFKKETGLTPTEFRKKEI